MSDIRKYCLISALCALSSLSISARADIVLTSAVPGNFSGAAECGGDVDLSPAAGVQSELLFGTGSTPIAVNFNAECAVDTARGEFMGISIFVDPAPVAFGPAGDILVPPSSAFKALCAGDGFLGLNNWVSAQSQGHIFLGAGVHSVRINRADFATSCWISDRSLIVETE